MIYVTVRVIVFMATVNGPVAPVMAMARCLNTMVERKRRSKVMGSVNFQLAVNCSEDCNQEVIDRVHEMGEAIRDSFMHAMQNAGVQMNISRTVNEHGGESFSAVEARLEAPTAPENAATVENIKRLEYIANCVGRIHDRDLDIALALHIASVDSLSAAHDYLIQLCNEAEAGKYLEAP
jgi:hypothetical protein